MVAYLTDVTLFWTVSLLLYTALFRKTTFHSTNRAVLLGTLLAGLLLPLWPQALPETIVVVPQYYQVPVTRISTAKAEVIAQVTSRARPAFTLSIGMLYGVGCAIAALIYLRGIIQLFRLTRRARKQSFSGKTFYETGVAHSPFSFLGKTFLTRADRYTAADLRLILQHESRHSAYRHSVDVLLLALLRVAFWFHPLVYLYDYLLKQVHEFQADAFARPEPQAYGYLLLQQGSATPFPLVHSFFRSPLKTRILMLTRTSTPTLLKIQYLLLIPMLLLAFEACRQKERSGNPVQSMEFPGDSVFYFRGNEFIRAGGTRVGRLGSGGMISVSNAVTKMNGEPVYFQRDVDVPAKYTGPEVSAFAELCKRILPQLQALPNGDYYLLVGFRSEGGELISKKGTLELYGESLIGTNVSTANDPVPAKEVPELSEQEKRPVLRAIHKAMEEGFSFSPALKAGKPVNSLVARPIFTATPKPVKITVQDGEVVIGPELAQIPQVKGEVITTAKPFATFPEDPQVARELAELEARIRKTQRAAMSAGQRAKQQAYLGSKQYTQEVENARLKAKEMEAVLREHEAVIQKARQDWATDQPQLLQQLRNLNEQLQNTGTQLEQ